MRFLTVTLVLLALNFISFSAQKDSHPIYGYWRFDKNHFKKVHPMWMNWMINKAMKTRLFISEKEYIQYIKPKKVHGKIRSIVDMHYENNQWVFKRKEKLKIVPFHIYYKKGKWYFKEGKKVYQIHKDSDSEVKTWYRSK